MRIPYRHVTSGYSVLSDRAKDQLRLELYIDEVDIPLVPNIVLRMASMHPHTIELIMLRSRPNTSREPAHFHLSPSWKEIDEILAHPRYSDLALFDLMTADFYREELPDEYDCVIDLASALLPKFSVQSPHAVGGCVRCWMC